MSRNVSSARNATIRCGDMPAYLALPAPTLPSPASGPASGEGWQVPPRAAEG
jgi:hypothetical protein